MPRTHTIGTNVYHGSVGAEQLIAMVDEIDAAHPDSNVRLSPVALPQHFVIVRGDLALLRAVIDRLEAAGFIE